MSVPVHHRIVGLAVPKLPERVGISVSMHHDRGGNICTSAPCQVGVFIPVLHEANGSTAPVHHVGDGNICVSAQCEGWGGTVCTSASRVG